MTTDKYHIYLDKRGEYRWHLIARNGRILASSGGDGYKNLKDCERSMWRVMQSGEAGVVHDF